jgi:uncharacterized protein with PQ loop repeat
MADQLIVPLMGFSAVALAIGLSLPQLIKLLRTREVSGVSLAAVANSTISFGAWTAYAVYIGDGWLLVSSAVGLPGQLLTAWVAWRQGASRAQLWLPMLWLISLFAVSSLDVLLGTTFLPLIIGASVLWYVVPALIAAWGASSVTGIAAGSWWVLVAEGAIFLGYGLITTVGATVVYGILCLVGSAGVLLRISRGDRSRPPVQPTEVARRSPDAVGAAQPLRGPVLLTTSS